MQRPARFNRPALRGSVQSALLGYSAGITPSLSLDFSSGVLDSRIDFQRTTAGTFYRGQFNQNLVTQSETFSGWFTDNATPANSSEPNPIGTGTAYGITETATTGNHRFGRTGITVQPSSYVTTSAYLKAGLRTLVGINNSQLANTTVTFQLTGSGSFGAIPVNALSASITPVGNGWYRCSVTHLSATNGSFTAMLNVYTGTLGSPSGSYAGDASAPAIYAWGVQATEGTLLTPYIPTTTAAITQGQIASSAPWNLLLRSQEFDNTTNWTNLIGGTGVNPVRTANNAVAPDGTNTADTITFNAGAGTASADRSMVSQSISGTVVGRQYTLSFWIRCTSGTQQVVARHVGVGAHTLITATTTWQRVSITETEGGGLGAAQIGIRQSVNGVINATATVELWGAQINEGSTPLEYRSTTSSALWLPRFDYNPISGAFRGLLIEGGATNLCLQSADLATTWVNDGTTEGTNVITAPDGTVSADSLIDTATTGVHGIFQAISGQSTTATYTISAFLKKGTVRYVCLFNWLTGGNQWGVCVDMDNPTQAGLVTVAVGAGNSVSGATITSVGNGWYWVSVTGVSSLTTHYPSIAHRSTVYSGTGNLTQSYAGAVTNLTYVWGFQYEQQAFASSYIPTTTATVARGADSAVMSGTNFSSWYNQSEGTLYSDQQVYAMIGTSVALSLYQGSTTYYELGQGVASTQADMSRFYARLSGVDDVVLTRTLTGLAIGNIVKSAAAYKANDVAFSANANAVQTDATFTAQTPTEAYIGRAALSNTRSVLIRSISYWPTRLPNDQLVSLTTSPSTALPMTAIQNGAKIDLSWTTVAGVDGVIYEVERSTNGGATWSPLTSTTASTFDDTTALFPGTYTYRVRGNIGGDMTDWSSPVSETTVDVPSAPGSLTVTGATTSSISLSWTDSTGEDSYGIEVSPDGFAPWGLAGTAPANTTTFTHTGLAESVQRYYRVNGINKAGGGVYSSTVNSWTVPLAPTGLTATAVSSAQIDLAWTDVSTGNTGQRIERRSPAGIGSYSTLTTVSATATTYSDTGLTASTQYEYRIVATNPDYDSSPSTAANATTQSGVSTYNVEYLVVAGGGGGSRSGGGAGGYRTASGYTLTPGTSYTITVGAGGPATSTTTNGSNSVFDTITSTGGGRGVTNTNGVSGGSGGGGGASGSSTPAAGSGTSGQGNAGGTNGGNIGSPFPAGAGGGAGAVGGNATSNNQSGNGGDGSQSSISGTSTYYAGGGAGGYTSTGNSTTGGQGGGGNLGTAGTVNSGGGGGGGSSGAGGAGGSGIVIIRMATANYSGTTTGSPTVTTSGSDTILTYNASGTYTA